MVDVVAGIIDSDYRGEVIVLIHNSSLQPYTVPVGARMAQIMIIPYLMCQPQEAPYEEPDVTQRGAAGFGASGY